MGDNSLQEIEIHIAESPQHGDEPAPSIAPLLTQEVATLEPIAEPAPLMDPDQVPVPEQAAEPEQATQPEQATEPEPATREEESPVIAFTAVDDLTALSAKAAYQDLFLRSIDAILLVDITTGNILEVNDASVKVFRLPIEDLQGTNIYLYCRADFLSEFKKMIRIASRRYHPKTFEIPMIVGNDIARIEITAEMAASPLKLNDQKEVLQLIFRDITEKKEAERKIEEYIKQIEEANKKLEELATTDGMTGLTNFRQFSKLLEMEHIRSSRYGSSYAIVFCDIDHFKKYNDQNGHPAGDSLLKHFAKVLKACVRTTDVPARYGGEEFVVLCPETNQAQAAILAERIRSTVAAIKYPSGEKQPLGFVSCSIGISAYPQDGATGAEVLKAADGALYQSKSGGRNRVTMSKGK
jgi:diguanylate cyclase (GGDEF)-like protein/PAS domain S-box-containing protein